MNYNQDGVPAFPVVAGHVVYTHGMTLRDWFAGQALAGIYANSGENSPAGNTHKCAREAYHAADAMLAARKDTPNDEVWNAAIEEAAKAIDTETSRNDVYNKSRHDAAAILRALKKEKST